MTKTVLPEKEPANLPICSGIPANSGAARFARWLLYSLSALLFLFAAWRAVSVPFTHDEAFTYLEFVNSHSLGDILFHPSYSSGNHLLNTVLMKVLMLVLPPKDWILRLPNLAAYALFLYAAIGVCRHLFAPRAQAAAFLLLNLDLFVLQFFSLARGYGLAMSLMMTSLLFFMRSLDADSKQPFRRAAALGTAALASFANLSFLNYYCALLLISSVIRFREWIRIGIRPSLFHWCVAGLRIFWDAILTAAVLAGTLLPFAMGLRARDEFYYGGNHGFMEDTVFSLMRAFLYENFAAERFLPIAFAWAPIILGLMFAVYLAATVFRGKDPRAQKAVWLYWILFVSAAAIVIQHYLLGTRYPFDRAAIFLIPPFVLSLAWLIAWEGSRPLMRLKTALLFPAVIGLAAWQFSIVANVRYATPWKFDAETKAMLRDLQAARMADGKTGRIRLGVTMPVYPSISFYAGTQGMDWVGPVDGDGIKDRTFDYYYILGEDLEYVQGKKAALVKHYALSKTWLFHASAEYISRIDFHRERFMCRKDRAIPEELQP